MQKTLRNWAFVFEPPIGIETDDLRITRSPGPRSGRAACTDRLTGARNAPSAQHAPYSGPRPGPRPGRLSNNRALPDPSGTVSKAARKPSSSSKDRAGTWQHPDLALAEAVAQNA